MSEEQLLLFSPHGGGVADPVALSDVEVVSGRWHHTGNMSLCDAKALANRSPDGWRIGPPKPAGGKTTTWLVSKRIVGLYLRRSENPGSQTFNEE